MQVELDLKDGIILQACSHFVCGGEGCEGCKAQASQ